MRGAQWSLGLNSRCILVSGVTVTLCLEVPLSCVMNRATCT